MPAAFKYSSWKAMILSANSGVKNSGTHLYNFFMHWTECRIHYSVLTTVFFSCFVFPNKLMMMMMMIDRSCWDSLNVKIRQYGKRQVFCRFHFWTLHPCCPGLGSNCQFDRPIGSLVRVAPGKCKTNQIHVRELIFVFIRMRTQSMEPKLFESLANVYWLLRALHGRYRISYLYCRPIHLIS